MHGHTDWVRSLCCTKDESRLISGSSDMTVRIWDVDTGQAIQILAGLERGVRCVCMSDDDKQIICGAEDKTIRTWDLETGCPIRILRGHTDWVTSVCAIPGSDKVVSCSSDLSVILWDVRCSPNLLNLSHQDDENKIRPVLSLCRHDENNKNLLITCTKDQIYVWDPQQQYKNISSRLFSDIMGAEISCICENKTNKSVIICCNYRSRGKSTVIEWLVDDADNKMSSHDYPGIINCSFACTNHLIIGLTQKNVILIRNFDGDTVLERKFHVNSTPLAIECVSVDSSSSSSILIIIGSHSKDILVWKYDGVNVTESFALKGHSYQVRCLTHAIDTNNNIYIVSGSDDYTLKLWRLPTESVVEVEPEYSFEGHARAVTSATCTTDVIISGSADCTIMIWCFHVRNLLRTLIAHSGDVTGLQISVTKHLVSTSKDGTLKVWDLSVSHNVPSDVELQELIRLRHKNYGYCEKVTDIIKSMTTRSLGSQKSSLLVDIIKNHPSLSMDDKSAALKEFNMFSEYGARDDITLYNMDGFLLSFQIRASKETMELVPHILEGDKYETIPLVHWMSCQPKYRDYLLESILPTHPELLYTRTKDGKTLFDKVAQNLEDPEFCHRSLQILSSTLRHKSLEMMWRDHYETSKNDSKSTTLKKHEHVDRNTGEEETYPPLDVEDEITEHINLHEVLDTPEENKSSGNEREIYPLLDVENIVQALQSLWQADIIYDGILSLQRAPDVFSDKLRLELSENSKPTDRNDVPIDLHTQKRLYWDSDSIDKVLIRGCNSVFRAEDVERVCNRRWIFRKLIYKIYSFVNKFVSSTKDGSEIMQVMYVPFPMRLCKRGRYHEKQHTSSLLLEVCVEIAIKKDDASIFESSALSAILIYKLKKFGWYAYYVQCFFCITLTVHFGYYAFAHSETDIPVWWPILLFIHFIPVVILEFLPFHLSTLVSLNSTRLQKIIYIGIFLGLLLGVVAAILWISFDQPGSEYDAILDLILFLILFFRAVNNIKYLHTYGLFVRMMLQVLGRMSSYILLLIICFVGFAAAFNILIPAVRRAYDQGCSDDNAGSDACLDMMATTERFQYPVISGVTTYLTMMNTMGWESTAFNISSAYSIYAFIILVCIFVFISNVALNITIALMTHIYEMISDNEHASCHLVQAQYVLGIERLLLYGGIISHDNPKHFPRWILVVCSKTHHADEKKHQREDNT